MSINELLQPNYYDLFADSITTNVNNISRGIYTPVITALNNCAIVGGGGLYFGISTTYVVNTHLIIQITNPALSSSMEIQVPITRTDGNFIDENRSVGFGTFRDSTVPPLLSTLYLDSVGGSQNIILYISPQPAGVNSFFLNFQFAYDLLNNVM